MLRRRISRTAIFVSILLALAAVSLTFKEIHVLGIDRESVKCFSTMQAPRVTAEIATADPRVWSERPTGTPNSSARCGIVLRFISLGGAG